MSNIAKQPVKIIDGVQVSLSDGKMVVVGPKGTLETKIPMGINVVIADNQAVIKTNTQEQNLQKFAGLTRALLANMVTGVSLGFDKKLELTGVGYRARIDGESLVLNVGYALPVTLKPQTGIKITVEENNVIVVSGIDKRIVGDVASDIRRVRPPDPYKGKGIRYQGEKIRRKVGKAAKAVGAAK